MIGASNEEGKIGNSVMKNLINGGYQGTVFPINPKSDTVLDLPAFKAITDVPGTSTSRCSRCRPSSCRRHSSSAGRRESRARS